MLKIQKLLKKFPLEKIIHKYALRACYNNKDDRVILNYTNESPKFNSVVKECRGLTLNRTTGKLVARAFPRFFNIHEQSSKFEDFNWKNFVCQSKEDGSLILLYYWNDNWRIQTRGSFGDGKINYSNLSWRQLFYKAIPEKDLKYFNKDLTYIFELVSPYNKVVREYKKTRAVLLSIFKGKNELPYYDYLFDAYTLDLPTPQVYNFSSLKQIQSFLDELEQIDPTNEGVVIRDNKNRRWKLKNKAYLNLSRLKGNDLFHPKHLLSFILKKDHDELLSYFPEVEEKYFQYYNKVWTLYRELKSLWLFSKDLNSQKSFALTIKHHPLCSVLFNVRKNKSSLMEEFIKSERQLLKLLKE